MLKWGLVGPGEIAGRSVGPALAKARGSTLHSVCGRSLAAAGSFAARFGAAKAVVAIEEMLADPQLDAVYIATPNSLHASQAMLAARAGKHVLCEKPMATSIAHASRMIEACEASGVKLGVVFQNRYHPGHLQAREIIKSGALGDIQFVSAQLCRGFQRGRWQGGWRNDPIVSGAGAIVAQGLHPIDLLRFLMDSEVVGVQSLTDEAPPRRPVEEMMYAILEFANGAHATVVAGMLLPRYDNDVYVYGSKAKISLKGTLGVPLNDRQGELVFEGDGVPDSKVGFPTSSVSDKLAKLIEHFTHCIETGQEPQISGRNGLQMVKIADALQQSSRSGHVVRIA